MPFKEEVMMHRLLKILQLNLLEIFSLCQTHQSSSKRKKSQKLRSFLKNSRFMISKNLSCFSHFLSQLLSSQEAENYLKARNKLNGKSSLKKKALKKESKPECLMIRPQRRKLPGGDENQRKMLLIYPLCKKSRQEEIHSRMPRMKKSQEFIRINQANRKIESLIVKQNDDQLLHSLFSFSLNNNTVIMMIKFVNDIYFCRMRLNQSSSSIDIMSEPDKQLGNYFGSHSSREKQKHAELLFQLDEARREIKRLHQTIDKLSQRERNSIMYFQTAMQASSYERKQLESSNQEYRNRLDSFENNRDKNKKSFCMTQSKLNRSHLNQSVHPSAIKINVENKENIDTINIPQHFKCNSSFCESKQQLQEVKLLTTQTINIVNNVLYSIKNRQKSQWNISDYDEWAKILEDERNKRKLDGNKTSIQLVKIMQQRLRQIHESLENETQKSELISQPLFESLKTLRFKQKNLMKIPFLEKIDIKQRRQDTDCFLESALLIKERMFAKFKDRNN